MKRSARGMTLLEVMLAIAIMGMVGLGTTAMMSALTTGMVEQHDTRSSMLRAGLSQARLSSYIATCRCLLDLERTRLVLWLEDADGDNVIDGTEVRWISWEHTGGALEIRWVADESGEPLDNPYGDPATVDWWQELSLLQQVARLRVGSLKLVGGVADWAFATDQLTSPHARRLSAMARRTVEASYELDIADTRIQHCLGDSIRMHDPPGGGDS